MSNVVAGIGRGQMTVLDKRVEARRSNFKFYQTQLITIPEISFQNEPENYFSNRWLSCILTDSFETRERLRFVLNKENIESRPLWKPMHLQPIFANYPSYTNGISEDLFNRGLCLPSGSNLKLEELEKIVTLLKKELCYDKTIS